VSDIEQILRRELDDVAGHVRTRRVPVGELVAAGRSVRRRRRAVGATLSAAVVVAVLALTTPLTGIMSSTPAPPAEPTPDVTRSATPTRTPSPAYTLGGPGDGAAVAAGWFRRWQWELSTARATEPPPDGWSGKILWKGRFVALPRGPEAPDADLGTAYAQTHRGLLVALSTNGESEVDSAGLGRSYGTQLGWITPDQRWLRVETGDVSDLVLAPDGSGYAYTLQTGRGRPFVMVARDARTDTVTGRYTLGAGGALTGWNRTGLVLALSDRRVWSTYTWEPGGSAPAIVARGWTPDIVTRGTRILASVEGAKCRVMVIDSSGRAPIRPQGCGPAELSPDGRYLVEGLVVTDLDTGGVTSLAAEEPGDTDPVPPLKAVEEVLGPGRSGVWLDDLTLQMEIDAGSTSITLRCTMPAGPCLRVVE